MMPCSEPELDCWDGAAAVDEAGAVDDPATGDCRWLSGPEA